MRIVVFGAGGRVGRRVVEYALEAGHEVRAIVRNQATFPFQKSSNLHIDTGDVLAPLVTQMCVRGAEAVISAVGNRAFDEDTTLRTEATRLILQAMNVHGASRLLLVSAAGLLPYKPGILRGEYFGVSGFERIFADHRGAWDLVESSGVDYTLACPARMAPGMRLRRYRRTIDDLPENGEDISPEDVADFLVDALDTHEFSRARVGIAY